MKTVLFSVAIANVLGINPYSNKGRPEIPNDFYRNSIHQQHPIYQGPIPEKQLPNIRTPNIREIPEYNMNFPKGLFNSQFMNGQALLQKHKQLFGIISNNFNGPNIAQNTLNKGPNIPQNPIHKGPPLIPSGGIDISKGNPGNDWLNNAGFPISNKGNLFSNKGKPFPPKGGPPAIRPTPPPVIITTQGPITGVSSTTRVTTTNVITTTTTAVITTTQAGAGVNNSCTNNFNGEFSYADNAGDQFIMSVCSDIINGEDVFYTGLRLDVAPINLPFGVAKGSVANITDNRTVLILDIYQTKSQLIGSTGLCYQNIKYVITCDDNGENNVIYNIRDNTGFVTQLNKVSNVTTNSACFKPVSTWLTINEPYLLSTGSPSVQVRHRHEPSSNANNNCLREELNNFQCNSMFPVTTVLDNNLRIACCVNQDSGSLFTVTDTGEATGIYDNYGSGAKVSRTDVYNITQNTSQQCPFT